MNQFGKAALLLALSGLIDMGGITYAAAKGGVGGSLEVKRATFKGEWPLVVPTATLRCVQLPGTGGRLQVATVETSMGTFALNGTAKGQGYRELGPLWLESEKNPGARVSIGDMISAALALCGRK